MHKVIQNHFQMPFQCSLMLLHSFLHFYYNYTTSTTTSSSSIAASVLSTMSSYSDGKKHSKCWLAVHGAYILQNDLMHMLYGTQTHNIPEMETQGAAEEEEEAVKSSVSYKTSIRSSCHRSWLGE